MNDQFQKNESGSSVIEMSLLGVLIFGVLTQLIVLLGVTHRSNLAAEAAAREVGRAVSLSDSTDEANDRAKVVLRQVERNHGLQPGSLEVAIEGQISRGSDLRIVVRTEVPAMSIPFVGMDALPIPIEARTAVRIDRYRSFS